jgi:hypothetical protein
VSGFNMDDYVPVNERLEAFYKKYPRGSIQSEIIELTESRVTVKAYAYREPDDPRPGTGLSSLNIPGTTSFTRGSEIENAETSAWGRAIAALGFEVKREVASREEVRNKQPGRGERSSEAPAKTPVPVQKNGTLRDEIYAAAARHGWKPDAVEQLARDVGVPVGKRASRAQLEAMLALIEQPVREPVGGEEAEVGSAPPGLGSSASASPEQPPQGSEASEAGPDEQATVGPERPLPPAAVDPDYIASKTGGTVIPSKTVEAIERAERKGKAQAEPEPLTAGLVPE